MGVSFETKLRSRVDLLMGRRCYLLSRGCHNIPIRRRGDKALSRLDNVPLKCHWVFHFTHICNITGTKRGTSLHRRHNVLLPGRKFGMIHDGRTPDVDEEIYPVTE